MEKIKVDLITLDAVPNYGSALQAFATQRILEQHGFDVTVINYARKDVRYENLRQTWAKGNLLKSIIISPTISKWKKVFGRFRNMYLNLTDNIYTNESDFSEYESEAVAYCVGSDQVWNSKWNNGVIFPLYLSFAPETAYKFSFASSFGQDMISDEEVEVTSKYIEQFHRLSVREDTGLKILKNQYGRKDVIRLLDPTLLIDAQEWRKISVPINEGEYILVYNLNRSKDFDKYAIELSKRTGLKILRLCTRYDQFYRPGKSLIIPEVSEFISYIDNAKYVLTDSFHAIAFSINMGTEPICVMPPEFSNRLYDFLKIMHCEHRVIRSYSDFEVVDKLINFDEVGRILETERIKADEYISEVYTDIVNRLNQKTNKTV